MDPNETLEEIRDLIAQDTGSYLARDDVATLIDRVEKLDQWLTAGNFLPRSWQH